MTLKTIQRIRLAEQPRQQPQPVPVKVGPLAVTRYRYLVAEQARLCEYRKAEFAQDFEQPPHYRHD